MSSPFADLRAQLDRAAPADVLPLAATPVGGGLGIEDLSLLGGQGASPGMSGLKASKMFSPVVLRSRENVCLAIIGQGATFCLRNSCTVVSHKDDSRRFDFSEPIIVVKKNETVAFCEPTAPVSKMDRALMNHWLSHPKTLPEWNEALLAFKRCVDALSSSTDSLVTADMLSAKKKFQREAQEVRTPARVLFSKSEDKSEEFVNVSPTIALSAYKPGLSMLTLQKFSETEKNLARHIKRVETGLESATHNLIQHRTVMTDQDKIMRGIESRLDTVQDQLGATPLGLTSEFEAPTLNGRVSVLAERISSLNVAAAANVSEPQVVSWVNQWWTKSDMRSQISKADDFAIECEAFLTTLVSTIKVQTGQVSSLLVKVNDLTLASASASQVHPPRAPMGSSAFATLSHSLGLGDPTPKPSNSYEPSTDVQASISVLEKKVMELTLKLGKVHDTHSATTVKFGGAGFASPRDVLPVIQAEITTSYFGCFVNAAILLEWILGNVGEDSLKSMGQMHKLKIPSLAEVHSLKGLEAPLPRLLGEAITFTGRQNTTFFSKVSSAGVWTNGSTGTKEFILCNLAAVVSAVRANIDQRLPRGKQLHTLARLALEASSSFVMCFVSFMEENRESYALSNYPDAMQWSLNTRLGYRVWQEVYLPCAGLMEKVEPHDLQATAATVIYHVLLTIDVQEEFRQVGFKNHSVISSEYVKFLSTNTGYDSIEKLTGRMNKLEIENKDLKTQVKEAVNSAKTSSSLCSDLKKKVDSHEKKFQQK
jgi:hypothetical protein